MLGGNSTIGHSEMCKTASQKTKIDFENYFNNEIMTAIKIISIRIRIVKEGIK